MPAVTVEDILVLPRVAEPDPAAAIDRPVASITTAPSGFAGAGVPDRRAAAAGGVAAARAPHKRASAIGVNADASARAGITPEAQAGAPGHAAMRRRGSLA